MTHIADDVDFIKRRMEEIEKEKELARNVPDSEQGGKTPAAEQEKPEPNQYDGCYYG